jgi:raffinose/stachyose/melibiose transport system substrate-binding protein
MVEYIESGKIADITDYMKQDNYVDKFMPAGISQATYKGKIWAMPVENVAVAMVFYNKKVFADNGIQVPTTLTELEAAADKLKAKGIYPFSLANKTKWTGSIYYMYLVDRIGGPEVFANAANRQNNGTFEDPTFTQAGAKIQEWVNKGIQ